MEETISIRESAKSLKKYGSTNNHLKRPEHYIKHSLSKTDTLQGIALKYGVTTEQIRRANRLWTNDSLFLRETLLVPVPSDAMSSPSEVFLTESVTPNGVSHNNNNSVDSDSSYSDFLCKIDCSIANTRSQVLVAQGNSDFQDEETLFVRRKPMSRLRQQQQQQSGELPVVMTQGRRVRNSLQRLEQRQDEMFEL